MDYLVDFGKIVRFLEENNWYQVDQSNIFLAKGDINLEYEVLDEWEETQKADLPQNIESFRYQLTNSMIVKNIFKKKVIFKYNSRLLKTVTLYKFSGHIDGYQDALRDTFFAKPENRDVTESVDDVFSIALIESFNNSETMGFVRSAHPNL